MLKQTDIMEAIRQLAVDSIPELAYVVEYDMPQEFKRPALLIEHVATSRTDAGATLVNVIQQFTITVFVEVDDYSQPNIRNLLQLQEKVMDLFLEGFIKVEDRALQVKASTSRRENDKAYVDIQLEYMDSRHNQPIDLPFMEELHTKIKP